MVSVTSVVGSADTGVRMCITYKTSRIKTFKQALETQSILGGAQPGAAITDYSQMMVNLAGARITTDGVLIIDSRVHRSQLKNREAAMTRLVALVRRAAVVPRRRKPAKPKAAARELRIASKKKRSAVKATRKRARDTE